MTMDRDQLRSEFLARAGWGNASIAPLAGDASNRRYLRLSRDGLPAVLMDAPPASGEDTRPFSAMTRWLRAQGLSAPALLAEDPTHGFLLLEDLGDALYARHLVDRPDDEHPLYTAAVDILIDLASRPPAHGLEPYDLSVLLREASLFTEWWLQAALGTSDPGLLSPYRVLIEEAVAPVAEAREVTVLRDYHAENLLWLPDRAGTARVGQLDYQDALVGHAAYDLVSLLEDARRDTGAPLREAMIAHYLQHRPDLDQTAFRRDYAILGAQRNLKIIGIFARLFLRDGKPRYLSLIPRVWEHLKRDLEHPALARVQDWVLSHAPEPSPDLLDRLAREAEA